jgi:hypothetical protein
MLLCFFKQCITMRCDLVHKDFSYSIWYCEALEVRRDNVWVKICLCVVVYCQKMAAVTTFTSQNFCNEVHHVNLKLPERALPLSLHLPRLCYLRYGFMTTHPANIM